MTNSAVAVANYFVRKSLETGKELTPMKVLKLVYIAHGWNLALYDEPLISDSIQAWKFGPVIPSVYQAFRVFRNSQITMMSPHTGNSELSKKDSELLDRIWDVYGDYDGIQLSAITHRENTPWDTVWNKQGGKYSLGATIPDNIIETHYKELAE